MRPLDGIRVVEMAGLAPAPCCGMFLSDFGADVVVLDRLSSREPEVPNRMKINPLDRGKRSIRCDLKNDLGKRTAERILSRSDVLLDPYRPGVMESLGLGPEEVCKKNPRLVYARLTGWGQSGPYSRMAGHDINYIALSGALSLVRRRGKRPLPPCNLLGDFAGGALYCALGILLALIERGRSEKGQVVDCAMTEGAASISTFFFGLLGNGLMDPEIGTNLLDGGAPFYQTFETADNRYVAVGALESRFYDELLRGLGIESSSIPSRDEKENWPELFEIFSSAFRKKTRDEWCRIFEGTDACVAPVLELGEVAGHSHNKNRGSFIELDDMLQPAPAPKLSRTPGIATDAPLPRGAHTREILLESGFTQNEIASLMEKEVIEENR